MLFEVFVENHQFVEYIINIILLKKSGVQRYKGTLKIAPFIKKFEKQRIKHKNTFLE